MSAAHGRSSHDLQGSGGRGASANPFLEPNDRRLEPLLSLRGVELHREIERLTVQVARPLVATILSTQARRSSEISAEDVDDIASDVQVRLITKLHDVAARSGEPIQDFAKYVIALTYNAVNDHLRRVFPARTQLKNRLRYVLRHDARLALWRPATRLVCGLSSWPETAEPLAEPELERDRLPPVAFDPGRPADALVALFEHAGRAIALDDVVTFFAEIWNVVDRPAVTPDLLTTSPAAGVTQFETRADLSSLWREIQALRPMQRKALLLNLRSPDAVNVLATFVITGITSFEDLASALEMSERELASIWNDLPFDDLRIASILGLTRQQVINLRRSARERLGRRLALQR